MTDLNQIKEEILSVLNEELAKTSKIDTESVKDMFNLVKQEREEYPECFNNFLDIFDAEKGIERDKFAEFFADDNNITGLVNFYKEKQPLDVNIAAYFITLIQKINSALGEVKIQQFESLTHLVNKTNAQYLASNNLTTLEYKDFAKKYFETLQNETLIPDEFNNNIDALIYRSKNTDCFKTTDDKNILHNFFQILSENQIQYDSNDNDKQKLDKIKNFTSSLVNIFIVANDILKDKQISTETIINIVKSIINVSNIFGKSPFGENLSRILNYTTFNNAFMGRATGIFKDYSLFTHIFTYMLTNPDMDNNKKEELLELLKILLILDENNKANYNFIKKQLNSINAIASFVKDSEYISANIIQQLAKNPRYLMNIKSIATAMQNIMPTKANFYLYRLNEILGVKADYTSIEKYNNIVNFLSKNNFINLLNITDDSGKFSLTSLALEDNPRFQLIKGFIEKNPEFVGNIQDCFGNTSLHYLSQRVSDHESFFFNKDKGENFNSFIKMYQDICKNKNIDLNIKNNEDFSALYYMLIAAEQFEDQYTAAAFIFSFVNGGAILTEKELINSKDRKYIKLYDDVISKIWFNDPTSEKLANVKTSKGIIPLLHLVKNGKKNNIMDDIINNPSIVLNIKDNDGHTILFHLMKNYNEEKKADMYTIISNLVIKKKVLLTEEELETLTNENNSLLEAYNNSAQLLKTLEEKQNKQNKQATNNEPTTQEELNSAFGSNKEEEYEEEVVEEEYEEVVVVEEESSTLASKSVRYSLALLNQNLGNTINNFDKETKSKNNVLRK